jgi:hypothetical protein
MFIASQVLLLLLSSMLTVLYCSAVRYDNFSQWLTL